MFLNNYMIYNMLLVVRLTCESRTHLLVRYQSHAVNYPKSNIALTLPEFVRLVFHTK